MLEFKRSRATHSTAGFTNLRTVYEVWDSRGPGDVNTRMGHLWRPDNRYPGDWAIRRHESGGTELVIRGPGGKRQAFVFPPHEADRVILSMLDVREF